MIDTRHSAFRPVTNIKFDYLAFNCLEYLLRLPLTLKRAGLSSQVRIIHYGSRNNPSELVPR